MNMIFHDVAEISVQPVTQRMCRFSIFETVALLPIHAGIHERVNFGQWQEIHSLARSCLYFLMHEII